MLTRRLLVTATVVVLHVLLFRTFWVAHVEIPRREDPAMEVALVGEPTPSREHVPAVPRPLRLTAPPVPAVLVDNGPVIQLPVSNQVSAPAAPTVSMSSAPVQVTAPAPEPELSVWCPERPPPRYPAQAKRQREQGEVRLRVELDEAGRITNVTIVNSSGSPRLDEAARIAIESWRCRPAQRDGQPVRAVALQSLAFVLDRR